MRKYKIHSNQLYYICPMGNIFGKVFQLTTFGESHGTAIGGIIDGFPAGININLEACLLYTSPSPRDRTRSRMPSSA